MKTILFCFITVLFIAVYGCSPEDEPTLLSTEIDLTSPEGVVLASSHAELKSLIRNSMEGLADVKFRITDIEYLEGSLESAAFINWVTEDGIEDGMVITSTRPGAKISGRAAGPGNWTISCTGECGCKENGTINTNGTVTVECSCNTCTMNIKSIK